MGYSIWGCTATSGDVLLIKRILASTIKQKLSQIMYYGEAVPQPGEVVPSTENNNIPRRQIIPRLWNKFPLLGSFLSKIIKYKQLTLITNLFIYFYNITLIEFTVKILF